MTDNTSLLRIGRIEKRILLIRDEKVIIDADLAEFYGVSTRRLNEQVKRNKDRFPEDFMFELSRQEKAEVVFACEHLRKLRRTRSLPYAFTEHGAIMAATIANFWNLYKFMANRWYLICNSTSQFIEVAIGQGNEYSVSEEHLFDEFRGIVGQK